MAALVLFLLVFPGACLARHHHQDCGSVFCGTMNISYPLGLKNQPRHCGYRGLELECDNNNRTTFVSGQAKFYVREIFYQNHSMRVVDAVLETVDCNSLPLSSANIDYPSENHFGIYYSYPAELSIMNVVNCTKPIKSPLYVDASRCTTKSGPTSFFYFLDGNTPPSDFNESCTVEANVPIMVKNIHGMSTLDIYNKLSNGFLVSWYYFPRRHFSKFQDVLTWLGFALRRYLGSFTKFQMYDGFGSGRRRTSILCLGITGGIALTRTLLGISCLIALVTYKLRRIHLSADDTIEEFLRKQNNLVPIRYSYKEIKKITSGFRDKLGEGGFGSVFKGQLRSKNLVAVKVLGKSTAKGEDFISEVATIGRIHHVNVAKLIGFCVEGSKQALVYDFMPNGSLDRIIFARENKIDISWQKMLQIVLGVARGIDYVHRGCDMQILHFDIKPHNILLDENFNPKVSDFGLAKLYSVEESIVSLTSARGTIGYIAPELIYKNLGGISYKADVYSFGMLLMEIVGRRKNLNAYADQSSQIYFPTWIYNQLDQGGDMELGDVTDGEKTIMRKLLIVAFWCIQVKPTNRPSMYKVLEMLETDTERLQMPPTPFQLPFEVATEDRGADNPIDEPSSSSQHVENEISLVIG